MIKKTSWLVGGLIGLMFFLTPTLVSAADYCFCGSDLSKATPENIKDNSLFSSSCETAADEATCLAKQGEGLKRSCKFFAGATGEQLCKDEKNKWEASRDLEGTAATKSGFRGVASQLIPECLLARSFSKVADDPCMDVSIFVFFLIQLSRYLFGVIGALALVMFVYGGFTLILSQGSSEKVKKGTDILVAAVIGLVIMFGAYMLVSFLGEAVNIKPEFQLTS